MNRYVHTVTSDNFYMDYDVKVQAKNIVGRGPESLPATIKSAEDSMFNRTCFSNTQAFESTKNLT